MAGQNQTKSDGLTIRQIKAVQAVLECPTLAAAAEAAGVARSTLHAWLDSEPFAEALGVAQAEAFEAGLDVLKGGTMKAARAALALLDSRNESVRLRASFGVLGLALKIKETADFEERLSRLEAQLDARPN